jgi:hypothetical protein
MFAALGLIFIVWWLMLDYSSGDTHPAPARRGKPIASVSAVLGFSFLAVQILQWAQAI